VRKLRKFVAVIAISLTLAVPKTARADMWGADIPILLEILANGIKQLIQLQQLLSTGTDTLSLLRDINRGIRDGLSVIQIINPKFDPGMYGDLTKADQALRVIQDLYGHIPNTADAKLQESQDLSVAESLAMHGNLYRYADQVDAEGHRMLAHAQIVSPQGAGKLQAQSLAVLIGVTTQLLRTNSAMLKLMAENLALSNRKEKLNAEQFKMQYEGLSHGLSNLPTDTKLPALSGTN
jgi:hypothetical protein